MVKNPNQKKKLFMCPLTIIQIEHIKNNEDDRVNTINIRDNYPGHEAHY